MVAKDPFPSHARALGGPAAQAFEIIPSGDDLPFVTSAIYVGTGGDVTLRPFRSMDDVTYRNVPSGTYLTVRAARVLAAGTTAADLVGEC